MGNTVGWLLIGRYGVDVVENAEKNLHVKSPVNAVMKMSSNCECQFV